MRPADPCGPTGRSRCYSDARRILYSFANEKVEPLRVVVNDDGLALRGAKHDLGLLNVGLTRTVRAASWIESSAIGYLPGSGAATARHDR